MKFVHWPCVHRYHILRHLRAGLGYYHSAALLRILELTYRYVDLAGSQRCRAARIYIYPLSQVLGGVVFFT